MNKRLDAFTVALTGPLTLVLVVATTLALLPPLFLLHRYLSPLIKSSAAAAQVTAPTTTGRRTSVYIERQ